MIENVIGTIPIPIGIAVNFLINGKDYLIPMAIEEPSVVAAASYAAKIARKSGGFRASSTKPIMIGQIQVVDVKDVSAAKTALLKAKDEIIKNANEQDPILVPFIFFENLGDHVLCNYAQVISSGEPQVDWIINLTWIPHQLEPCEV